MKKLEDMTLEEKIEYYELQLREKDAQYQLKSKEAELSRARSYSVGSTSGGSVELVMRGIGNDTLWYMLHPVEVSELIHTLAASIGCYAALRPREDFAAWRNWNLKPEEKARLFGDPESAFLMSTTGRIGLENNKNGSIINNEQPGLKQETE